MSLQRTLSMAMEVSVSGGGVGGDDGGSSDGGSSDGGSDDGGSGDGGFLCCLWFPEEYKPSPSQPLSSNGYVCPTLEVILFDIFELHLKMSMKFVLR